MVVVVVVAVIRAVERQVAAVIQVVVRRAVAVIQAVAIQVTQVMAAAAEFQAIHQEIQDTLAIRDIQVTPDTQVTRDIQEIQVTQVNQGIQAVQDIGALVITAEPVMVGIQAQAITSTIHVGIQASVGT
jgi:hypothetical protein